MSAPWVDEERDRPTLEAYAELRSPLMMVDRARTKLLDTQYDDGQVGEQIKELTAEISKLDYDHDRYARTVFGFLTSLADRADDPQERDRWLARRNLLFPAALSINALSYVEESGNVEQTRARITPELRQVLDQTQIDGESLGDLVDLWLDAGERLGKAVTRRARLKQADDNERVTAGDVQKARYFWISAVDGFVNYLNLVEMDDDKRNEILSPLREAIHSARPAPNKPEADASDEDEPAGDDVVVDDDLIVEDPA